MFFILSDFFHNTCYLEFKAANLSKVCLHLNWILYSKWILKHELYLLSANTLSIIKRVKKYLQALIIQIKFYVSFQVCYLFQHEGLLNLFCTKFRLAIEALAANDYEKLEVICSLNTKFRNIDTRSWSVCEALWHYSVKTCKW